MPSFNPNKSEFCECGNERLAGEKECEECRKIRLKLGHERKLKEWWRLRGEGRPKRVLSEVQKKTVANNLKKGWLTNRKRFDIIGDDEA